MKYNFKQDELYFELDLEKDLGGKVIDPSIRRQISEDLIDKIISRANSNEGYDSKTGRVATFKPKKYSDSYAESMEFKAWGKNKNDVNLKLTGSMQASIDMLDDTSKKIQIGINNEDAPKAHGHQTGDGTAPRRPFLGVTKGDLEEIKRKYKDEIGSVITVGDVLKGTEVFNKIKDIIGV